MKTIGNIENLRTEILVNYFHIYTKLIQKELYRRAVAKDNDTREITDLAVQIGFFMNEQENRALKELLLMIAHVDLKSVVFSLMQRTNREDDFKVIKKLLILLVQNSPKAVPKWIIWGMTEFCVKHKTDINYKVYNSIAKEVFFPILKKQPHTVIRSLVGSLIDKPYFIHGKRFLIIISSYKEYGQLINNYLARAKEKNSDFAFMTMADEILYHVN